MTKHEALGMVLVVLIAAMGAVVIRDVPAGAVVAGNPAVVKKMRAEHMEGTAFEHWGPVREGEPCPWCKLYEGKATP